MGRRRILVGGGLRPGGGFRGGWLHRPERQLGDPNVGAASSLRQPWTASAARFGSSTGIRDAGSRLVLDTLVRQAAARAAGEATATDEVVCGAGGGAARARGVGRGP